MIKITKEAKFIVMCVVDDSGFIEKDFQRLISTIIAHSPDEYLFLTPNVVEVFLLNNRKNLIKHEQLKMLIKQMISEDRLSWLYGESSGNLVAEFSIFGKLKSIPAGIAINHALQQARNREKGDATL